MKDLMYRNTYNISCMMKIQPIPLKRTLGQNVLLFSNNRLFSYLILITDSVSKYISAMLRKIY